MSSKKKPAQKRILLSQTPYHSERLWTLIRADGTGGAEMARIVGDTQINVWAAACICNTRTELEAAGWRAKMIFVQEENS